LGAELGDVLEGLFPLAEYTHHLQISVLLQRNPQQVQHQRFVFHYGDGNRLFSVFVLHGSPPLGLIPTLAAHYIFPGGTKQ
jgi:hypothetical protein